MTKCFAALMLCAMLAACSSAPKKTASAPAQPVQVPPAATASEPARKVSPYAPAQEDVSKRGNYVTGGLYAPGVADTVPDYIPNVDAIPEPEVRDEPRSRWGNRTYAVLGKQYEVMAQPQGYVERGTASYYGNKFHGRRTSNQEVYDMYAFSAAHRTLPLPSFARVTNLDNGRSVVVRVNDRGPFHGGRLIDLSYAAAVKLGYREKGTARVEVRALTPAEARSTRNLVAAADAARTDPQMRAQVAQQVATSNAPGTIPLSKAGAQEENRFDMTQNGRAMSADEFDAWLKARRVRVATGKPGTPDPLPTQVPAQTPPAIQTAPLIGAQSNTGEAPMVVPQAASSAYVAPPSTPATRGPQLQVASFASEQNARHALDVLQKAGVNDARLMDATVNGRRVWRLRVGPVNEAGVTDLASRIAGLGFGQPAVVRE